MMRGETSNDGLAGCRILVVEDEMLIAMLLEETLQSLGCIVVGPVSKLDVAVRLASEEMLDAAVLDVNIHGGKVFPAAEHLAARGIPFVLASGYTDWVLPQALQGKPRLTKPDTVPELEQHVRRLCRPSGGMRGRWGM